MTTYHRSGALKGTDTVDTVTFTVNLPADISYTVRARGSGDNELRVRCAQKLVLIWAQVHDFKLSPGESKSRSFSTSIDGTTPTIDGRQDVRIKLSRKILTKELDWELDFTVT